MNRFSPAVLLLATLAIASFAVAQTGSQTVDLADITVNAVDVVVPTVGGKKTQVAQTPDTILTVPQGYSKAFIFVAVHPSNGNQKKNLQINGGPVEPRFRIDGEVVNNVVQPRSHSPLSGVFIKTNPTSAGVEPPAINVLFPTTPNSNDYFDNRYIVVFGIK